jgi:DNA polymerase III sliding clamp (beta) subunit (PCNA family)
MKGLGTMTERTLTVHSTRLIEGIDLVKHAASTHPQQRPALNCILLEGDAKGVRLVAADNYRIAIADISGEASEFGQALIWLRDIPLVVSIARATSKGSVELTLDGYRLTVATRALTLGLNLCEVSFPDYRSVDTMSFGTEGRSLLLGINPQYIGEALRALGRTTNSVAIYTGATAETPLLIDSPDYRELIMPVRLAEARSAA